jgi:ubiquinone/menaquinone biosynthesis C-methylase UbiE
MVLNKKHWYDGWFYDRCIAPNQDRLFAQIKTLLPQDSTVLDVGCGTGRLAFTLADKCSTVVGIDLSKRNITRAQFHLSRARHPGVSFAHARVGDILADGNRRFDYAVLTYVLHEVAEEDRARLLDEVVRIAGKVVVGDYLVPVPGGFLSLLNEVVERVAGRDHYRNFRSYVARGGIAGMVASLDLEILQEFKDIPGARHLVVVQGREA